MKWMGYRWRAPKQRDEKAWRMIEAGDFLWDKNSLAKNRWWQRNQPEQYEHLTKQNPKYRKSEI
jgi:hypothetical protein